MTVFFKNDTPERLAKLEGQLAALKAETSLTLVKLEQQFNQEMEEMENALLARIAESEKSARGNSLKADEKAKAEESEQIGGGIKTWSQRKAERVLRTADPSFAQKTLKRSQRTTQPT